MGKKCVVLCIAAILLLSTAVNAAEPDETAMQEHPQIIEDLRNMVVNTMETDGIMGMSVALVDTEEVLWAEGFGYKDKTGNDPVDTDTIFSIQSMSKTITATAVMKAVSEGILDLDVPITEYLPDFTVHSVYEEHPEQQITLRHLSSHRAGFTHEAPVGNNADSDARSFDAHIRSISDTWLRFPVGLEYAYSNLGIDLAGYILEKVSGQDFSEYVREHLTEPIGMVNSSFDMDAIRDNPNRAVGQCSLYSHMPLEIPMIPSGGFYASANDMAKFVQYHLQNKDAFAGCIRSRFHSRGRPRDMHWASSDTTGTIPTSSTTTEAAMGSRPA